MEAVWKPAFGVAVQVVVASPSTTALVDAGLPHTSVPLAPALAVTMKPSLATPVTTNDTVRAAAGEPVCFAMYSVYELPATGIVFDTTCAQVLG